MNRCMVEYCDGLAVHTLRDVEEPDNTYEACDNCAEWLVDQGLAVQVGSEADEWYVDLDEALLNPVVG